MRVNGTIHKRNFDGTEKWYFLEELTCDMFIGYFIPNDATIQKDGRVIENSEIKDWFEDNEVANAEVEWVHPDAENFMIETCRYFNIEPEFSSNEV